MIDGKLLQADYNFCKLAVRENHEIIVGDYINIKHMRTVIPQILQLQFVQTHTGNEKIAHYQI
jgi:hypothetical protein